jgi:putative peptide maturation system protein
MADETIGLERVLETLQEFARQSTPPERALPTIRALQSDAAADIDLVWFREAYDESLHYDALIRLRDGTACLSWCPESALPWPVRGSLRRSDSDLLQVNGTVLSVGRAMALLDVIWNDEPALTRLIDAVLMQTEVRRRSLTLSDSELQTEIDAFRAQRELWSTDDTTRWLADRGLTYDQLEVILHDHALFEKLVDDVTRERLAAWSSEHAVASERFAVEWLGADSPAQADAWLAELRSGRRSLLEIAREQFSAAPAEAANPFAVLGPAALPSRTQAALHSAAVGDLIGPLEIGGKQRIVRLLARSAASERERRACARRELFETWLAEHRRSASVEWFWGRQDG